MHYITDQGFALSLDELKFVCTSAEPTEKEIKVSEPVALVTCKPVGAMLNSVDGQSKQVQLSSKYHALLLVSYYRFQ